MCWRKDLNSIQERMMAVMKKNIIDICHDVKFVVGKNKVEISCHKIFLAIASPVFETMFSLRHSSQKTPTMDCKPIEIPDVHPDGLKNIIKYAYTTILNVDVTHAAATMYAAHKYDIPELTQHCSQVLHSQLSLENVVTVYQAALLLEDQNLGENAWTFIEENAAALLDSDEFLEFSDENLRKFLSFDSMQGLKSEVDVFKALLRWGTSECNQRDLDVTGENMRSVLEPYISLIRFPAMKGDEFIKEVQNSGILSLEECVPLFNYFILSGEERVSIGASLQYPCKSRVYREGRKFIFCSAAANDNLEILSLENYASDDFLVTGNAGTAIKLKSVGIVLPSNSTQSGKQSVSISLHDFSIRKWTHNATGTVSRSLKISYIEFDPPVNLQLNVQYRIVVNYYNGSPLPVDKRVALVKYTKELMNESSFTWSAETKHQLKLGIVSGQYIIWALEFEN